MSSSGGRRHRWERLGEHHYRCTSCGMERENCADPADANNPKAWVQVFTAPGGKRVQAKRVPPCPGPAPEPIAGTGDLAAAAFAAAASAPKRPPVVAGGDLAPRLATDGRRVIRVVEGELPRVVDEAEAALMEGGAGVFVHGTRLVRVGSWDATQHPPQAPVRQFGAVMLFDLTESWLVEALTRAAVWERWDGRLNDWRCIDAPAKVAKTLLSRGGLWRFPHLTGFCESPTLGPGGRLLAEPGYDPQTGLYLVHDVRMAPVDLTSHGGPQWHAQQAAGYLCDLLQTFPFVTEADRSAALALLLTAIVRRLLPAAPIGGISAHTPRTGKSLLARCLALIVRGQPASVLALGADETETEKRVDSALLDGDALVLIDNVSRAIKSDVLCQVATEPLKDVRVLGASTKVRCPTNVAWLITGNNLTLLGDLAARCVMVRLDAGVERPEERTFDDAPPELRDIEAHVMRVRADALRAALIVVQAYMVAGSPPVGGRTWSDFRAWDRWVRSPLIWAGLPDPMEAAGDLREEDHEFTAMSDLLAAWHAWKGHETVTSAELFAASQEHVAQFAGGMAPAYPDLHEAMTGIVGDSPRGGGAQVLGYRLRSYVGRVLGKYRIAKAVAPGKKSARWYVEALS